MFLLYENANGKFRKVSGKFQYGAVPHAERRAEKIYGGKLFWESVNSEWHGTDKAGKLWYRIKHEMTNPSKRTKTMRKKKRSAKQLANDKRLGRMAKARAKKKRGGRRKVTRKKTTRKNPARTTRAKSHLWIVFKCQGKSVYFLTLRAGKPGWTLTKGDAIFFNTKSHARTSGANVKVAADWSVGIAPDSETAVTIAADCRRTVAGK